MVYMYDDHDYSKAKLNCFRKDPASLNKPKLVTTWPLTKMFIDPSSKSLTHGTHVFSLLDNRQYVGWFMSINITRVI